MLNTKLYFCDNKSVMKSLQCQCFADTIIEVESNTMLMLFVLTRGHIIANTKLQSSHICSIVMICLMILITFRDIIVSHKICYHGHSTPYNIYL